MDIEALESKLAEAMLAFHDSVRKIGEPLSDDDLRTLAERCKALSGVTETRNFAMPEWGEVGDVLLGELGARIAFRRADEHMKATGETYYCLACNGTCKGHD